MLLYVYICMGLFRYVDLAYLVQHRISIVSLLRLQEVSRCFGDVITSSYVARSGRLRVAKISHDSPYRSGQSGHRAVPTPKPLYASAGYPRQ